MVFQSYALYPHMSVFDNMSFALRLANVDKAVIKEKVERAAEDPEPDALPAAHAEGAVGRPAPARGDRPRDRARAQGVPVRRAAVQPRRRAARPDARRDRQAAPRPRRDHDLRHARPGRGDDAGRPRGGAARRRDRAGRLAAGAVRPAGQPVRRAVHRHAADEHDRHRRRCRRCATVVGAAGAADGFIGVRPGERARAAGRRGPARRRRSSWSSRSAPTR